MKLTTETVLQLWQEPVCDRYRALLDACRPDKHPIEVVKFWWILTPSFHCIEGQYKIDAAAVTLLRSNGIDAVRNKLLPEHTDLGAQLWSVYVRCKLQGLC